MQYSFCETPMQESFLTIILELFKSEEWQFDGLIVFAIGVSLKNLIKYRACCENPAETQVNFILSFADS